MREKAAAGKSVVAPTKESLGWELKEDRRRHILSKPTGEVLRRDLFVHAIRATVGNFFVKPVQHVADVVQQGGGNYRRVRAGEFGGVGCLQTVFKNETGSPK